MNNENIEEKAEAEPENSNWRSLPREKSIYKRSGKKSRVKPGGARGSRGNKIGRMDIATEQYIIENYLVKTVDQLAEETNRARKGILRFIKRMELDRNNGTEEDNYKIQLYKKQYWREIKEQLLPTEVAAFAEKWIAIMKQFNFDILPSEELQVNRMLILEILRNRAVTQQTDCLKESKPIQDELILERNKGDEANFVRISELENRLVELKVQSNMFLKQHTELSKESDKLFEALKASRKDRVKVIQDASKSFTAALNLLEGDDIREHMSKEVALMNVAQQKAKIKLMQPYLFVDKKTDFPMLSWETVELQEELNKGNKDE